MSSDEPAQVVEPNPPLEAAAKKERPRLNLSAELPGGRERKRGKSMFGILLGTLNKAKIEDKERNASEAAKKRQLIEQRLQLKLRKETDSVRRAEEAKRDKTTANRKEEELFLKDSIYKLRRKRLPLLAHFLVTSDNIPTSSDSPIPSSSDALAPPPRSHPPPLYYLPAVLTSGQESFLARRRSAVEEAVEMEWQAFCVERTAGIEEILTLRRHVLEEEARQKEERQASVNDRHLPVPAQPNPVAEEDRAQTRNAEMDETEPVEDTRTGDELELPETKEMSESMHADEDDAVEY